MASGFGPDSFACDSSTGPGLGEVRISGIGRCGFIPGVVPVDHSSPVVIYIGDPDEPNFMVFLGVMFALC